MSSPSDDTFPHNYLSTSPAHGVPGQHFIYAAPLRSPSPILLDLPIPAPKSRERYASYVWNASVLLADKIAGGEIAVEGKTVLELGCGLGLPGIMAARRGAKQVVLSDYDDAEALSDTRAAVEEALPPSLREHCVVAAHSWGMEIDTLLAIAPHVDMLFIADCVWERSLHTELIASLRALLDASPGATVYFASGFHTGRKPVADFLAQAAVAGIVPLPPEDWVELSVEGECRPWNWSQCGRAELAKLGEIGKDDFSSSRHWAFQLEERQEERNRWTLYGTLRLRED